MPAKGSKLLYGNRDYVFNKKFFKSNLVEKHKFDLSFKECKDIIDICNKNIADSVVEELDGFKLPFGLGYICVGRFIPKNPAIDWKTSQKVGTRVYFNNLHTFGYSCKTYWFRVGRVTNTKFHETFKFSAYKTLGISVSKAFASGKKFYQEWSISDLIEKGRLENLYSKKFRKKELSD